jgi:hypothetical protein
LLICPIQLLRNLVLFNHIAISYDVFSFFQCKAYDVKSEKKKTARDASFKQDTRFNDRTIVTYKIPYITGHILTGRFLIQRAKNQDRPHVRFRADHARNVSGHVT